MVLFAIAALFLGILYGLSDINLSFINLISNHSDLILYILMFLVGISVGLNKGIVSKIREYHIKIFIVPMGVIIASFLGGIICCLITGYDMDVSTAIASGLGWYSLAGVSIGNLAGAAFGSIAFLSNLMREIFSFFAIPWISRHLNYYSCIASAAATSEDTTLPMMIRYTNEETVVLSVFNGVICSAFVPVLITFCFQFF